jgi:hypothetical protein
MKNCKWQIEAKGREQRAGGRGQGAAGREQRAGSRAEVEGLYGEAVIPDLIRNLRP